MEHLTEYRLEELLEYEQPTAYIVSSTDYSDNYKTPVLTAGKSFILGYTNETAGIFDRLPVIIFDDFTTAIQYVSFPFKVKSSAMKILHINKDLVHPKYIFYRMQVIQFDHSTHKRYWIQQYSKIKVKIPPLPEQERIVARIEELFSELDKAVETLNTTKQQLAVYRQAVLKEALTPQPGWQKTVFSDLLTSVRNGYGKKPDDNGEYRILRISSVRPDRVDLSDFRCNQQPFSSQDLISENDLLFTRYNGSLEYVGVCGCVPVLQEEYAYPDKIIKCTPKINNQYHSRFLQYYLNQGDARKYILSKVKTTSGQKGIAGSDIKRVIVYVPELFVQEAIVKKLDAQLTVCDQIEKTIEQSLQQADALRQSILKQAFEGRLESCHQ